MVSSQGIVHAWLELGDADIFVSLVPSINDIAVFALSECDAAWSNPLCLDFVSPKLYGFDVPHKVSYIKSGPLSDVAVVSSLFLVVYVIDDC
jgi:hypothetical protein